MTDLALGKFLRMSYADIRTLPVVVYAVALEEMHAAVEQTHEEAPV